MLSTSLGIFREVIFMLADPKCKNIDLKVEPLRWDLYLYKNLILTTDEGRGVCVCMSKSQLQSKGSATAKKSFLQACQPVKGF